MHFKSSLLIFPFIAIAFNLSFGQATYSRQVQQAKTAYQGRNYTKSALLFRQAFAAWPDSVRAMDVFGSARSWAAAGKADSAIVQLQAAVTAYKFSKYGMLMADPALIPLHQRSEWVAIATMVNRNMRAAYSPLQCELQQIKDDDQKYRLQADSISKADGMQAPGLVVVNRQMALADSVNLVKVKAILDSRGWPTYSEAGDLYAALFLVIQHADLLTQLKYLPMIQQAETNSDVDPESVAMLQDRILVRQGKKQLYGSQLYYDDSARTYKISPIVDEARVNDRRAAKGMAPLQDYLKQWGIIYLPVK